MSITLSGLVWGARPFGSSSLRIVLASLADQVNEQKHGTWCFPSLQLIQDRTELSRRTVIAMLKRAKLDGWLTVEPRPGYGNAYVFQTERLRAAQAKECRSSTRAYVAPVQAPTRGANDGDEGCKLLLPNKEEPEVNQKLLPLRGEAVAFAPKRKAKAKPRAEVDRRHTEVRQALEAVVAQAGIRLPDWGPDAAGSLGQLLRRMKESSEFFQRCANNWANSAPRHKAVGGYTALITMLLGFQHGPKDEFGNVKTSMTRQTTPPSAVEKVKGAQAAA